jgi:hypothetical protein
LIEGLDDLLEGSGLPGLAELRRVLGDLLGGPGAAGRLADRRRLAPEVYRLRFEVGGRVESFVVKRLEPGVAWRNQLLAGRWLPALGLGESGPPLRGEAPHPNPPPPPLPLPPRVGEGLGVGGGQGGEGGRCVWHVYDDLGDRSLDEWAPDPECVGAAVELIARLHTRSAGHPLLPECRLHGGDLGAAFYAASVSDAARSLEALRPPAVRLSPEWSALRDRLLGRLEVLLREEPRRAQVMRESGGPEALLHGDLWPKNVLVAPQGGQVQARLIDWDRAGVGPVSYDLSTFLGRFPAADRPWILDRYRREVGRSGWRLPPVRVLNLLFETAECARLANCIIWRALAVWECHAEWALHELASLEEWLGAVQALLPPG